MREVLPKLPELPYLGVAELDDGVVVARTGYTGEHGYEIFCAPGDAPEMWDAVVAAGAVPCGLAARDTLRLEMGYPLHGNDIDPDTTPREAGLGWAVAKAKPEYLGKEANESRPPRKQLVGIKMLDKVIPRRDGAVLQGARPIGRCTSGTFSPTLRIGIALAYVEPGSVAEGDRVDVEVRAKTGAGVVTKPPFVPSDPRSDAA
jgi:aminomethyltransferase